MKERLKVLSIMSMVLFLSLTVVSCSNDDEEKENNSIVGTWKFKSVAAGEIKTNSTVNDEKIKPEIIAAATDDFKETTITLKSDGTFIEEDKDEPEPSTGTYTFSDGVLTLINKSSESYSMKASVENGILTIEQDYTFYCNGLQLDKLIELGISDPVNFQATKAIAKISFNRQ
ncbi:DUF5004 domain-containing protein [Dysgonomonas termitidis]|uniref:DUF5004 domain-containing protein n=1 Tax=Dysgonomonas termitidis TaxID=1516126 RepID=A0ABV9KTE7_9BACT